MQQQNQRTTRARLVLPDLARGLALLGIATANASSTWIAPTHDDPDNSAVLTLLSAMFVHVRGLPMFSTLLGFGFGLVAASLARKAYPLASARWVLIKRYGILGLFGLVHMVLLFFGDIMFTYGLIGIGIALLLTLRTKILRIIAYTILGLTLVGGTATGIMLLLFPHEFSMADTFVDTSSVENYFKNNLIMSVFMLVAQPLAAVQLGALTLLGVVWAREGTLVDIEAHKRTLVTWVALLIAVVCCVGGTWGVLQIIDAPAHQTMAFETMNDMLGMLTGPGILALLALLTRHVQYTPQRWMYPFIALGKRSMSGYLAQTLLFIPLAFLAAAGYFGEIALGKQLLLGCLVWAVSLGLAVALERANFQGPFEAAHRRLSYGKTKRIEPFRKKENHHEQLPGGAETTASNDLA